MNTTPKLKLIVATGLYAGDIGGPATYALMLEDELPKLGIETVIVPFGWVRHYPKIIRHLVYAYKLWCESKGGHIIYALDPVSVGLPALVVSRLLRLPFMIRLGGDYAWEQGRNRFGVTVTLDEFIKPTSTRSLPVRLLSFVQAFVTTRAIRVIAPSEYLKSVIASWGVSPAKITVIYSALSSLEVEGTKEELRTQLEYTYPTIISAGRLVPWKGFSALLRVVARLKEKYPDVSLVIAGDGPLESELKAEAVALDIQLNVRFVGRISKEALGACVKAADVFVLNTAYEGLSHQLIETMDLGTPIVTTPAGGNPELITDTVNGLLVPFDDEEAFVEAISRLLDYPDTRTRIVQSARGRAREFSQEAMTKQLYEVLQDVYVGKS
jgi:glycosyltransferase involved in cell wall biosynthesis